MSTALIGTNETIQYFNSIILFMVPYCIVNLYILLFKQRVMESK